jgi:hypothetical protein
MYVIFESQEPALNNLLITGIDVHLGMQATPLYRPMSLLLHTCARKSRIKSANAGPEYIRNY